MLSESAGNEPRRSPSSIDLTRASRGKRRGNPFAERHRLVGIIRNAEPRQQIGQPHHAESDLSGPPGRRLDLFRGVVRCFDQVVEEDHRVVNRLPHALPFDVRRAGKGREIDRAERAGFVRQQRLLTARIRRLDSSERRGRIMTIDLVEEEQSRIARGVRRLAP